MASETIKKEEGDGEREGREMRECREGRGKEKWVMIFSGQHCKNATEMQPGNADH